MTSGMFGTIADTTVAAIAPVGAGFGGPSLATWLRLGLALALVLGMILALQWAARRFGQGARGTDGIRVVSQRSLGPKLSLAVIEVGGRTLLIGLSPNGVAPVADLTSSSLGGALLPGAALAPASVPSPAMEAPRSFRDELEGKLGALRDRYVRVDEASSTDYGVGR